MNTYEKIENVMRFANKPLAAHEFREVYEPVINENGLSYVGCSESTLGRRLRELRELGRVKAQRREGKSFVEYSLVKKAEQIEFPAEAVAA